MLVVLLCLFFFFFFRLLPTALERIRQDFLSDTQDAINNMEMRASIENFAMKKDQHSKVGSGV